MAMIIILLWCNRSDGEGLVLIDLETVWWSKVRACSYSLVGLITVLMFLKCWQIIILISKLFLITDELNTRHEESQMLQLIIRVGELFFKSTRPNSTMINARLHEWLFSSPRSLIKNNLISSSSELDPWMFAVNRKLKNTEIRCRIDLRVQNNWCCINSKQWLSGIV